MDKEKFYKSINLGSFKNKNDDILNNSNLDEKLFEKRVFLNSNKSKKKKIFINDKIISQTDSNKNFSLNYFRKTSPNITIKKYQFKNELKKLNSSKFDEEKNKLNKTDNIQIKSRLSFNIKNKIKKKIKINSILNKTNENIKNIRDEIYLNLNSMKNTKNSKFNKYNTFINKDENNKEKINKNYFGKNTKEKIGYKNNPFNQQVDIIRKSSKSPGHKITKEKSIHNIIQEKDIQIRKESKKNTILKKLSKREKSYYLLSNSPILRLTERLLFGRSTHQLRELQSISGMLNKNEIILKNKKKELEEEIKECDKKLNLPFNASKTAEIAFNFILSKDEEEFKRFIEFIETDEEKKEYYVFLKLLYLLIGANYENVKEDKLEETFNEILNKKGFKNIKDCLYSYYIKKQEYINIFDNIDKINSLLAETPNLINKHDDNKFCRFALLASFLINEIIQYNNDIKNTLLLKVKAKGFINIIENKIALYKNRKIKK